MRFYVCALVSLALGLLLMVGCDTVDPGDCWPNTSGGLGGEMIPIGAGVGATSSGDFDSPPPKGPLKAGGATPNPCVTPDSQSKNPPKNPPTNTCKEGSFLGDGQAYAFCDGVCPQDDVRCTAGIISMFGPSNFTFVTIVPDDGKGKGGGWQEARTSLIFADGLFDIVACKVRIGIPVRTELMGVISASAAAGYSANVANAAAGKLWPTDLPAGIFCSTLKGEMAAQFMSLYPNLGARMMDP